MNHLRNALLALGFIASLAGSPLLMKDAGETTAAPAPYRANAAAQAAQTESPVALQRPNFQFVPRSPATSFVPDREVLTSQASAAQIEAPAFLAPAPGAPRTASRLARPVSEPPAPVLFSVPPAVTATAAATSSTPAEEPAPSEPARPAIRTQFIGVGVGSETSSEPVPTASIALAPVATADTTLVHEPTEGLAEVVVDTTPPRVVGAIARGHTSILVSFSEALKKSALDPRNFEVRQDDSSGGFGVVRVLSAAWADSTQSAVLLTTLGQSEVLYRVTAVNIRDLSDNPLAQTMAAAGGVLVNPTVAIFRGQAFAADPAVAGSKPLDTDGDGLTDSQEQAGWVVEIIRGDGTVEKRGVTSDPFVADTDSDGVTDISESTWSSDPRSTDTDTDALNDNLELNEIFSDPTLQDTDEDGFQDGLEYLFFKTSPLLADTDGDKDSDQLEIFERNHDPRIADLPQPRIIVGEVRLQIDERFTYVDTSGSTVSVNSTSSASLAQSADRSSSTSDTGVTQHVAGGSFKVGNETESGFRLPTNKSSWEVAGNYQYTTSDTHQVSLASAQSSQQVHEQSLAKGRELSSTSEVTREVFGARMDVDLTIENAGQIAFTISNVEVTALQPGRTQGSFLPVATLLPNSTLISGQPASFSLGAFATRRGPFLFSSSTVFPNLVDELMNAPSGLIFQVANFELTDEFGRNFVFSNQQARDRTSGVTIDYGDGVVRKSLVATSGAYDEQGFAGTPGAFIGGFDGARAGKAVGLPLDYVLQDVLGMSKNAVAKDGIVAGVDRTADSVASGDDVQLIPPGTTGVSVGSIVVGAGSNGVLDSAPHPNDLAEVTTGYETGFLCSLQSGNAGDSCTDGSGSPSSSLCTAGSAGAGVCDPTEVLVRVGSYRRGDFNRDWYVLSTDRKPAAADFGTIRLRPGQDVFLAFLQDLDRDGLFAQEEYLYGSTDSARDVLDNWTFGPYYDAASEGPCASCLPADGIPDSKDTDRDGLGDYAETNVGWTVAVDAGLLQKVYSSPRLRDSDGDLLSDPQESDLRQLCSEEVAGLRCPLEDPVSQADAVGIIAGPDGVGDTAAGPDDVQLAPVGSDGLYGTAIVGPGADGVVQTIPEGDDEYEAAGTIPIATDPSRRDTDQDGVDDYSEVAASYGVGLAIVEPGVNGVANTTKNGDDIRRVFPGDPVRQGGVIILPGPNGRIDSVPAGNDVRRAESFVLTDPLRRDSDEDLVADGRERDQGGNPANPNDGADFADADLDGLTDAEEALGWAASVNNGGSLQVASNPTLPDSDLDGLPDYVERTLRTNPNRADTDGDSLSDYDETDRFDEFAGLELLFPGFYLNPATSQRLGTKPTHFDSDGDNWTDDYELFTGFRIVVPGESKFRQVFTNPNAIDTDADGAFDGTEAARGWDPTDADTDDDGRTDWTESLAGTDPLVPDARVTVDFSRITVKSLIDNGNQANGGEVVWHFTVRRPDGSVVLVSSALNLNLQVNNSLIEYAGRYLSKNVGLLIYPPTVTSQCYSINGFPVNGFSINGTASNDAHTILKLIDNAGSPHRTSLTLRDGQSFSVEGLFFEGTGASGDCGYAPNYIPTGFDSGCYVYFNETFTFDDIRGITSTMTRRFSQVDGTSATSCKLDIDMGIQVD